VLSAVLAALLLPTCCALAGFFTSAVGSASLVVGVTASSTLLGGKAMLFVTCSLVSFLRAHTNSSSNSSTSAAIICHHGNFWGFFTASRSGALYCSNNSPGQLNSLRTKDTTSVLPSSIGKAVSTNTTLWEGEKGANLIYWVCSQVGIGRFSKKRGRPPKTTAKAEPKIRFSSAT